MMGIFHFETDYLLDIYLILHGRWYRSSLTEGDELADFATKELREHGDIESELPHAVIRWVGRGFRNHRDCKQHPRDCNCQKVNDSWASRMGKLMSESNYI